MPNEKEKTLMYIVDDSYHLLYANDELLKVEPNLAIGEECYRELNNALKPCDTCPIGMKYKTNNTYYSKRLDEWFTIECLDIDYKNKKAKIILLKPIADKINQTLNTMLKEHSFDVLVEIDLANGGYRILKTHPLLKGLDSGNLDDIAGYVASSFIEGFDFYRFKKFIDLDNIKDRFKANNNTTITNNFRLKDEIKRAEWIHIEILPCDVSDDLSNKILLTITFVNTSVIKESNEDELDSLTGLSVAPGYLNKIESIIKNSTNIEYAIASIDIDHFKIFNEWYGLKAGDIFLKDLGSELKSFDKQYKTYSGYLGNDNFAVLLPNDLDLINELKNRLVKSSKSHGDGTGFLPSIGIYLIEDKKATVSQMLDRATIAASNLKDGMANRVNYYSSSMMNTMESEYKLLHDAINSIKNDEFVIYFQPKVNMLNGKIFSAEALVRWPRNGKIVPPDEFIPILEKTGSIVELDTFVWEKTMMWQRSLIDRGIKPISVSVNVSRIDLYYLDVADIFINLSKKHRVPPALIEIEITESTYAEKLENIQKIVDKLRAYGFKISLDDFGAGYSSLNALKNISVDILKLDIKFLDFASEKEKAIRILESVINMINSLHLTLICEGVETKEEVEILMKLGCHLAQGFYYYRPMPLDSFEQFLAVGSNIDYEIVDSRGIAPIKFKELLNYLSYSDTLLDNILGPVVFLSYDGANIELLKLNESFSKLTGIKNIDDKNNINNIKNMVEPADEGKITTLFMESYNNPINGASDIVRFNVDGETVYIEIKIFYLDSKDNKNIYFISSHIVKDRKRDKLVESLRLDDENSFEYDPKLKTLAIFNPSIDRLKKVLNGKNIINDFPESILNKGYISKNDAIKINLYATSAISKIYDSQIKFEIPIISESDLFWLRIHGEVIADEEKGNVIVGSFRDISEEIVSKKDTIAVRHLQKLKQKCLYSAFANLTDNILYSITNSNYETNDEVFNEAHDYDILIKTIVDYVATEEFKDSLGAKLNRDNLIKLYHENQKLIEFDTKLTVNGTASSRHVSIYMYDNEEAIYAYMFVTNKDDIKNNDIKVLSLEDSISHLSIGVIRYDISSHMVVLVNEIALKICGYNSIDEYNLDLRDDFSNRILDEDKPGVYMNRKKLVNFGDTIDLSFRIYVNHEIKHIRAQEEYIKVDGREYIQRIFLDNTLEKNASLKKIDEEQKRIAELDKETNYNKAILIGINKLYISSYSVDINNNKYEALKYSKQMSELISISNNWEEFMLSYAKCYVHSENRKEFIDKTSLSYIKANLSYENDRLSIRYKRLVDNSFKWFKMYIIASSFDNHGMVDNIIIAFRDVDSDIKMKEAYESKIEYYKDLFLNSSVDVYSGMLLIDLDDFKTKDIVFTGKDINEREYQHTWDKLFYRVLDKIDLDYHNEVIDAISPNSLKEAKPGYNKTIKYKINYGFNTTAKSRFVSTTVRIMIFKDKKVASLFTIDITDDIKALEEAEKKSNYDRLTGLYNRKKLDEFKDKVYPSLNSCGVIFFDINGLKKTNDTLGHKAGDSLIKIASQSLSSICNENIIAYRYGGDEFLVIYNNPTSKMMDELVKEWKLSLSKFNTHSNIICSMSYGYSISSGDKTLDELILEADKVMYQNKNDLNLARRKNGGKDVSKLSSLLKFLDTSYIFIYEVDLDRDQYRLLHINQACPERRRLKGLSYTRAMEDLVFKLACDSDKEAIRDSLSIPSLRRCYLDKKIIKCRLKGCSDEAILVLQGIEFEGGEAKRVIIGEKRQQ